MRWVLGILVLALVGMGAVWLSNFLNRRSIRRSEEARNLIRERLLEFRGKSIDEFLDDCDIAPDERARARMLLQRVAQTIGVPPETLTSNQSLDDMLTVNVSDLQQIGREGAASSLQPYAYDVLHVLESSSVKESWRQFFETIKNPPKSEQELIDFIMSMTPAQLVRTFGPICER